jgi:hypothetical protein
MPPQQPDRLLDFINEILSFGAHVFQITDFCAARM